MSSATDKVPQLHATSATSAPLEAVDATLQARRFLELKTQKLAATKAEVAALEQAVAETELNKRAAVSKYEEKTRFIRELQTDLENRIDETNQEGEDVQATLRDLEEERRRLQEQLVQTVENELAP